MGANAAIPILMYHNVARVPPGAKVLRSLYVSPARFGRQMRLLKLLGYTGLSMGAAMPYLRGEREGKVVVLTFDDGYVDNLDAALPVLAACGFSATCYVVTDTIGGYNRWDAERLGVRKPLMAPAQLRAWLAGGMELGAHTCSHPRLSRCDDTRLRHEIHGSRAALEDCLAAPVTQFCYPYGDLDDRAAAQVQEAGFVAATTTRRGRARAGSDLYRLPRIQVARHHLLPQFAGRVLTAYEDRRA